jgi:ubiquinol-cytochrome c reductase iron-sulfur subunit
MNCLRPASRAVRSSAVRTTSAPLRPPAAAAVTQVRNNSDAAYKSPFAPTGSRETTKVPDFSKYRSSNTKGNQLFGYFMVGTMGALSAAGAKATVQGEIGGNTRAIACTGQGIYIEPKEEEEAITSKG